MQVLSHESVDSKVWAEAVEWLMLYGPREVRDLLLEASRSATSASFPDLKPSHFTTSGEPLYDVASLARTLGIQAKEAQEILRRKEETHGGTVLLEDDDEQTVH